MAKNKGDGGNQLLQLVGGSIGVDKGDVTAVMVAQIEAKLNADYKFHRSESKRLVAEAGDAETAVRKALVDAFTNANKDSAEQARSGFDSFKQGDVKVELVVTPAFTVGASPDKVTAEVTVALTVAPAGGNSVTVSKKKVEIPASYDLLPTIDGGPVLGGILFAAAQKRQTAREHDAQAVELQRQLRDIPAIERSARAMLATEALKQSPDGEALLEKFQTAVGDLIKALPQS